jgi:hypothetical protein
MFQALRENGWQFRFRLEATSPRGWPYQGEGATAEEAFLRAFRAWESDLRSFVPRVPAVVAGLPPVQVAAAPAQAEPPKRRWRKSRARWLLKRYGQRAYLRNYMRMYRKELAEAAA